MAEAFDAKGLKVIVVFISVGAIAGLIATLLVRLYVQSRPYPCLGRDGLLPLFYFFLQRFTQNVAPLSMHKFGLALLLE